MKKISLILLVTLLLVQCKKKETEQAACFDKASLLNNIGSNIAVPRYQALDDKIQELQNCWNDFKLAPTIANLHELKTNWKTTNHSFQKVKVFNFGPALQHGLSAGMGTFPTDTIKIQNNMTIQGVNLYTSDNVDAVGLPALEFLFFNDQALTNLVDADQSNYVDQLLMKMIGESSAVLNAWNSGYLETFKSGTGTESTSGFSLLVNAFNFDYELAKNAKLGIPIGKQSLGIPQLEYEEAPYSKSSLKLLKENVSGLYDLYRGIGPFNSTLIGFSDYLIALEKESIDNEIKSRFEGILSDIEALNEDLALEVQNQPAKLESLYAEMQNLVVYLKTDMTSAFSVLITYQDNDGD